MRLLLKDQIKKIKHNLLNFISLSILVMLISFTFTASKTSILRLEENYIPYLEEQQVQHFQFDMSSVDISYLTGTQTIVLCKELGPAIEYQCYYYLSVGTPGAIYLLNHEINKEIDNHPETFESIIDFYIEELEENNDFTINKKLFADIVIDGKTFKFTNITEEVNIPYIVEGSLPEKDYEIAVFPEFAKHNNLSINDTYTIGDTEYTITGFMYSPDFAFPVIFLNSMDVRYETLVLTTEQTINALDTYIERIFVGRGNLEDIMDAKTYTEISETDTSAIGKTAQHVTSVKPSSRDYRIATLILEVENAKIFTDVFLGVFMIFVSLLIIIILKRYIDKNRKDLEVLTHLGYSKLELSTALMLFPFLISLLLFIGWGLGLLSSDTLFQAYSERYLFPKAGFQVYTNILIDSVLYPFIGINLISFIFIQFSLRRNLKKSPKIKFRLFKYTPTKTVISSSILLLSLSIMMIFGLNANSMFEDFAEVTKLGNNYYEMLRLDYFTNDEVDDSYQTFTREYGKFTSINGYELDNHYGVRVYGLDSDNDLKLLINNDIENNTLLEDGIIISEYTKEKSNLEIGDEVVLNVKDTEYTYTIVGITNELIENSIYMKKEDLNQAFYLDNTYYNGIYTTDDLYESDHVIQRINYQNGLEDVLLLLDSSSIIANFIITLSLISSVFIFALILMNYMDDNKTNIAILKSVGYNHKEINRKFILNIYIIFIIAFLIGIPATRKIFDYIIKLLINRLGYILLVNLSFGNIVISFIILSTIFIVTIYFTTRYMDKITISSILKQKEM